MMLKEPNLIEDIYKREIHTSYNRIFRKRQVYTTSLLSRLTLLCEFKKHDGCVNCIEWNKSGTIIASGSDDHNVMLWDAFKQKHLCTIETEHRGNIFDVKFLPCGDDNYVVSSAADHKIFVHNVNQKSSPLHEINSHHGRIKRLATTASAPFLFWSAGEDGFIMQHDIRCRTNETSEILIGYSTCECFSRGGMYNDSVEAKCLAINPIRPELLAVGCNDPFARIYDIRMIARQSCSNPRNLNSTKCIHECIPTDLDELNIKNVARYYVPGHLPAKQQESKRRYKHYTITYLTFNENGTELLVNISGEQVYLFDVNDTTSHKFKYNAFKNIFNEADQNISKSDTKNGLHKNGSEENLKRKKYKLPPLTEELKQLANDLYEAENYFEAIEFYNKAIYLTDDSPILYGNRAAALLKRRWNGDLYEAMRDCYRSLYTDKGHMKSHFRLARCLNDLKYYKDANECLSVFRRLYPDYADSQTCENLINEIETALAKQEKNEATVKRKTSKNGATSKDTSEMTYCKKLENILETEATDYKSYFIGHCNVATDIKEANFIGENFIGAGSDDGSFYIWDKRTTNLCRILKADESIVNCLQPNPYFCLIASSGIDPHIRLWSPSISENYDNENDEYVVKDIKSVVEANQKQMNANPMDLFFMNFRDVQEIVVTDDDETSEPQNITCRTS